MKRLKILPLSQKFPFPVSTNSSFTFTQVFLFNPFFSRVALIFTLTLSSDPKLCCIHLQISPSANFRKTAKVEPILNRSGAT